MIFSHNSEPVTFERDCDVVMVPVGNHVTIPAGSIGYVTQALGGSFTIFVEGNLFRVSGQDADAIGKEPLPLPELPENATDSDVEELVQTQLKSCYDPEIPVDIVELGLIYKCDLVKKEDGQRVVNIDMTLTAPGCGMGDVLVDDVRSKVQLVPTIEAVNVHLVFDPPWHQDMMSERARLETGMM